MRRRPRPLAERFWRYVPERPTDGCWPWKGTIGTGGYGVLQNELGEVPRMLRAHRAMWFLHHGKLSADQLVLHRCDTPACIRLEHLYVGTHADNTRDKVERGRHRSPAGEDSGTAKLTADDVREVLRRQAAGDTMAAIARDYRMSETQVRSIVFGRKWRHVVDPWRAQHGQPTRRANHGETAGSARLREADVLAIRAAVAANENTREIAKRFGISRAHVQKLASGVAWPHLRAKQEQA